VQVDFILNRSARTIQAQLVTHLVARSSSGPTVVCKKNLSSTELPPTPELGAPFVTKLEEMAI